MTTLKDHKAGLKPKDIPTSYRQTCFGAERSELRANRQLTDHSLLDDPSHESGRVLDASGISFLHREYIPWKEQRQTSAQSVGKREARGELRFSVNSVA